MSVANYRVLNEYVGKTLLRALEIFNDGSATTNSPTSADQPRMLTSNTGNSIATELIEAIEKLNTIASGKASPSSIVSATAASGSWSSATQPTQSISVTGVTASNNIAVSPASNITSAQLDALLAAKIVCTAQAAGSITLTCYGTEPSVNIPLSVLILS